MLHRVTYSVRNRRLNSGRRKVNKVKPDTRPSTDHLGVREPWVCDTKRFHEPAPAGGRVCRGVTDVRSLSPAGAGSRASR
jgi:hypothetical protein